MLPPAPSRWTTVPRLHVPTSVSRGSPLGSSRQACRAKRSMPLVAKVCDTSRWWVSSRCTTTEPASRTAGHDEDASVIENARSGGSAEIDTTDVAVNPTGPSAPAVVMTATPLGWWRNSSRNAEGAIGAVAVSGMVCVVMVLQGDEDRGVPIVRGGATVRRRCA